MEELPTGLFNVGWIPSHLDRLCCSDDWEEWVATWNGVADQCAVAANQDRGAGFAALQHRLQAHRADCMDKLRSLRAFYVDIAAFDPPEEAAIDLTADDTLVLTDSYDGVSLSDSLAVNWTLQLQVTPEKPKFPLAFVASIFEAVCHLEQTPEIRFSVSFIELTLWMLYDFSLLIPVWDSTKGEWKMSDYFGILLRPTFVSILTQVKQAFQFGLQLFGLSHFSCKALNRVESGIQYPVDGLVVHTSMALSTRLRELTSTFNGSKGIRKVADLAKPLSQ